jgi:hypothetical protein
VQHRHRPAACPSITALTQPVEHRFTNRTTTMDPEIGPITPRMIPKRGKRKLNAMYERTERTERHQSNRQHANCHQTGTHAGCPVDPGDTHDKGEESLCVGEAA